MSCSRHAKLRGFPGPASDFLLLLACKESVSSCACAAPPALLLASCLGHQAAAVVASHRKRVWSDANEEHFRHCPGLACGAWACAHAQWRHKLVPYASAADCSGALPCFTPKGLLTALALRSGNFDLRGFLLESHGVMLLHWKSHCMQTGYQHACVCLLLLCPRGLRPSPCIPSEDRAVTLNMSAAGLRQVRRLAGGAGCGQRRGDAAAGQLAGAGLQQPQRRVRRQRRLRLVHRPGCRRHAGRGLGLNRRD